MILFEFGIGLIALSAVLGLLKYFHPVLGYVSSVSAGIGACLIIASLVMGLISN
jgi:hypothetical protein